jgi:hypothetical protein
MRYGGRGFNLLNGMVDYYVNLSRNEEIQYMRRIIKKKNSDFIFYYLWDLFNFLFIDGMEYMNYLSISLGMKI